MSDHFQYDVFLSHASADKAAVRELAQRLKEDGLRVWLDEWVIQPGDMVSLKIEQGLESSRTLVLVMSQAAFDSEWVTLERHTALFRDPNNKERRFIPLLLDDAKVPDVLKQYAYVDWWERAEEEYQRLLHCVGAEQTDLTDWYKFDSIVTPIVFYQLESRRPRVRNNRDKSLLRSELETARRAYNAVDWSVDYDRNTLVVTAARVVIALAGIFDSTELLAAVSLRLLRLWRTKCQDFNDRERETLFRHAVRGNELEICELFGGKVADRKPLPR